MHLALTWGRINRRRAATEQNCTVLLLRIVYFSSQVPTPNAAVAMPDSAAIPPKAAPLPRYHRLSHPPFAQSESPSHKTLSQCSKRNSQTKPAAIKSGHDKSLSSPHFQARHANGKPGCVRRRGPRIHERLSLDRDGCRRIGRDVARDRRTQNSTTGRRCRPHLPFGLCRERSAGGDCSTASLISKHQTGLSRGR
jgi:hypothetical protein